MVVISLCSPPEFPPPVKHPAFLGASINVSVAFIPPALNVVALYLVCDRLFSEPTFSLGNLSSSSIGNIPGSLLPARCPTRYIRSLFWGKNHFVLSNCHSSL